VERRLNGRGNSISKRPATLAMSANRSYYSLVTINYNTSLGRYIRKARCNKAAYILYV
jgi:hypothetical protein